MKKRYKYSFVLVVLLVLTEIGLRLFMDIGEKPLYEQNDQFEYALKANQDLTRFHHHYQTNALGMRSKPINPKDKKRVLLFGDSVLNGGTDMDQEETIPYILEKALEAYFKDSIGVYAASAGSWGVENAYRFLETKIDFEFDMICLVFSSHDYHDNMHHRPVVGIQPAWPSEQPTFAITDLFFNGIWPKINTALGRNNYDYLEGFDDSNPSPGFNLFNAYAQANNIPIFVYIHPEQKELEINDFNWKGKTLIENLDQNNILNLNGLKTEVLDGYIDNVHVNNKGHLLIATAILNYITSTDQLRTTLNIN